MTSCRWFVLVPVLLATLAVSSACARKVAGTACTSDVDCKSTEVCDDVSSTCMTADEAGRGCTLDIDCDVTTGEVCLAGVCQVGGAPVGSTCTVTADCPMDAFCNSATSACQPLLEGWCREASQCSASAPVCSSSTPATPGRCVECLTNDDCSDGQTCKQPGVCDGDGAVVDPGPGPGPDPDPTPDPEPEPLTCPANAHASGTRCVCDSGFIDDGAGGCAEDAGTTEPEGDVCAEYGWYGDDVCDDFCPSPDPDCTTTGPDPTGDECIEAEDCWATNIDNTCEGGQCVCDIAWMESFNCDIGETVDAASCTCRPAQTMSTGLAENESCVTAAGSTLACDTGLECIYATDSLGDPSYGSCKKICTASSECGTGRTCALGFLTGGDGICGTPKTRDQTGCTFWDQGDTFCFDPSAPAGSNDAVLECLNSTCEFMCDYEGNTGSAFTCPSGDTCGQPQPMSGFDVDVAQCQ